MFFIPFILSTIQLLVMITLIVFVVLLNYKCVWYSFKCNICIKTDSQTAKILTVGYGFSYLSIVVDMKKDTDKKIKYLGRIYILF